MPVTVTVTVAVSVPPWPSDTRYVTVVERVSPAARSSNAVPGSNDSAPVEEIVKLPPAEPATALPTLPATPLTSVTVSVSPSGSVSVPPPVMTLPLTVAFSVVPNASSAAVGAGLETVQVKVCDVGVVPSVAVTVTEYGPETLALAAMVPEMTPAFEIDRPGGSPVAEKVSVLLVSGSENEPETSTDTTSASLFD